MTTTSAGMKSVALLTVEEVFAAMDSGMRNIKVGSHSAKLKSSRLKLFRAKGTTCYKCRRVGNFFSLEDQTKHPTSPHFNLYALEEGRFTLFTKDHLIPRFYGGPDHIENYGTMCAPCNSKRGHDLPSRETAEHVVNQLRLAGYKFEKRITLPFLTIEPDAD